jgi:hypothetical protein
MINSIVVADLDIDLLLNLPEVIRAKKQIDKKKS